MAGSIVKQPWRLGAPLLLLALLIIGALAAQALLSDSGNQTSGTIRDEAGAAITQTQTQAPPPGPVQAIPAGTAGTANGAFGDGATGFISDLEAATGGSSGGSGAGSFPAQTATGTLSGRVVSGASPDGPPIGQVSVYLADGSGNLTGAGAVTAGDGSFHFAALKAGQYRLFFTDPAGAWKSAWYGDPAGGSPITVNGGSETIITQALRPTGFRDGSVSGRVTDANGKGVSGVKALAYFVDEGAGIQLLYKAEAVTDENGEYTISGLEPSPTGTGHGNAAGYKIRFQPGGGLAGQWFSGQATYQTAKLVEVGAGKITGGIDACLGLGGTISGRVTIESGKKPAAYVLVDIFDEAGVIVDSQLTAADGSYRSDPLPAGAYRVRVTPRATNAYTGEWYKDKPDFASADKVFVVSGSNMGGIDMNLDPPVTHAAGEPQLPPGVVDKKQESVTKAAATQAGAPSAPSDPFPAGNGSVGNGSSAPAENGPSSLSGNGSPAENGPTALAGNGSTAPTGNGSTPLAGNGSCAASGNVASGRDPAATAGCSAPGTGKDAAALAGKQQEKVLVDRRQDQVASGEV